MKTTKKTYLQIYVSIEESDQPAYSRSDQNLHWMYFVLSQGCKVSSSLIRLRGAHADLSLLLAHMSEGTFSHVTAKLTHFFFIYTMFKELQKLVYLVVLYNILI